MSCRCLLSRRGKFCKDTGTVIERFDHYCPWIDNAVGLGNQRRFYLFLANMLVLFALNFYLVFEYLKQLVHFQTAAQDRLYERSSAGGAFGALFGSQSHAGDASASASGAA